MKNNIKKQKGITLIALIITIIVLLILAVVSIYAITNEGIITKASDAKDTYTAEQEKELIGLAYSEYKISKIDNPNYTMQLALNDVQADAAAEEYELDGWIITFNQTGNQYILFSNGEIKPKKISIDEKYLETYFLGEDKQGIDLYSILDGKTLTFSDKDVTLFNMVEVNGDTYYWYVKYNNKAYKVVSISSEDSPMFLTKSISLIYTPNGREGQTISYSYDGTSENEQQWTILYDNGESIEILSPTTMGNLLLGSSDEETQGSNNIEKAIYSYNNAVNRINKYASNLITNSNKISVRSVGSNPIDPYKENTTMYTSDNLVNWNSAYNGRCKGTDNNWEQDYVRMCYWNVSESLDSKEYWLASREIEEDSDSVTFSIGAVESNGPKSGRISFADNSNHDRSVGEGFSNAVRPVVKINF